MPALSAVVVALAALSLSLAQKWGWATPFALPSVIEYHGHRYAIQMESRSDRWCGVPDWAAAVPPRSYWLGHGYLPQPRPVGEVFGYFTDSKPILLPQYESGSTPPYVVEVQDDGCLRIYGGEAPSLGGELPPSSNHVVVPGWVGLAGVGIAGLVLAATVGLLVAVRRKH